MIAVVVALSFSCSSDNDEPSITISKDEIVGLWDATEIQFNNDGKWISIANRPDMALSIYFYEDGSYYGSGALGDGEGTYTLSGNTIKTFVDGSLYASYVVDNLAGDSAELTMAMDGETMRVRAKKSKLDLAPIDSSIVTDKEDMTDTRYWQLAQQDGDILYVYELDFCDFGELIYNSYIYKIDQNGTSSIFINGQWIQGNSIDHTPYEFYQYSYNGKLLVVRNYNTKEESIFNATVVGDKLTISYHGKDLIFSRIILN